MAIKNFMLSLVYNNNNNDNNNNNNNNNSLLTPLAVKN